LLFITLTISWHRKDEGEESEGEGEDVGAAMAAVKLE